VRLLPVGASSNTQWDPAIHNESPDGTRLMRLGRQRG